MSIDPRIIKSLLQLQLTPGVDFKSAASPLRASVGQSSASLFDTLLSQYMSDSALGGEAAAPVMPAEALAQLSSLSGMPNILDGGNHPSPVTSEYDELIMQASSKYNVDASLIQAVIRTESGFRADAVSGAGAKGLMQLMDGTARGLGVTDSFDPEQNIDGGTKYLAMLLRKYDGNVQVALAAYNAGPGRVDRAGIKTNEQLIANHEALPEETQRYVAKVLQAR
ncbi:lytic transglycosylase domain-containing protein [Paenibacillus arenilitoris]|uniref:Lytic transglycosylase domain-containing protein n=1 Tax=Paenibacillus arenilitoris TaxID=2772299 RepID=A0A927CNK2_9BACL|nr:lytic transglycosylase domain-containing protein [Paenibacillus arenilitoris]MBD2870157.1 lytic transglycosylase domain-containing protein [Paenibacillus arenilitoris]